MNRWKTIFCFAIVLTALAFSSGFCAELKGFLEKKETGVIDWASGIVTARGISTPIKKDASTPKTSNPKSLSEAKNKARHKLLETVKRIQVDANQSVGDIADRNKTVMAQIQDMIYHAVEIEKLRKYMSDGSIEVQLQLNLHGGFAQLILPPQIRQIEMIKQLNPGENASNLKSNAGSNGYTGLLVDARNIEAIPALVPKILDENLAEVFGPAFVSREFVVQHGMAAYYTDIASAKADPRVANQPLVVKALRTDWPRRCNIVISNGDASKLKSASDHLLFLKQSQVVIVLSAPSSRQ
jgi:hypothetical protein